MFPILPNNLTAFIEIFPDGTAVLDGRFSIDDLREISDLIRESMSKSMLKRLATQLKTQEEEDNAPKS